MDSAQEKARKAVAIFEAALWLEKNRGYTREETNEAGAIAAKLPETENNYAVVIAIRGAGDSRYKRFSFTVRMKTKPEENILVTLKSERDKG